YADAISCKCLYVGSEKSYQQFQKLTAQRKMSQDYRWAAQANMDARMNFGMWGPWGPWGPWLGHAYNPHSVHQRATFCIQTKGADIAPLLFN
ncbi:MAG: hypothetical protein J7M20_01745, partial [Deltaproteobacteria bacterium]|nr:hypothetical protein [Deltaproteobacteria bacterium]